MYTYLVLALLALGVSGDHHALYCNDVETVDDIDYDDYKGHWVAVETVGFKDGHEFIPEGDKRPEMCIWADVTDTSDHGMTMKLHVNAPGADVSTETLVTNTVDGQKHGRIAFTSDKHDRANWEVLVMDAKSDKHFVYMLCEPPNADGKRLPKRLVLLARHESHSDHEAITTDEEHTIERRVADKLHIAGEGIKPVRFGHACWKDVE